MGFGLSYRRDKRVIRDFDENSRGILNGCFVLEDLLGGTEIPFSDLTGVPLTVSRHSRARLSQIAVACTEFDKGSVDGDSIVYRAWDRLNFEANFTNRSEGETMQLGGLIRYISDNLERFFPDDPGIIVAQQLNPEAGSAKSIEQIKLFYLHNLLHLAEKYGINQHDFLGFIERANACWELEDYASAAHNITTDAGLCFVESKNVVKPVVDYEAIRRVDKTFELPPDLQFMFDGLPRHSKKRVYDTIQREYSRNQLGHIMSTDHIPRTISQEFPNLDKYAPALGVILRQGEKIELTTTTPENIEDRNRVYTWVVSYGNEGRLALFLYNNERQIDEKAIAEHLETSRSKLKRASEEELQMIGMTGGACHPFPDLFMLCGGLISNIVMDHSLYSKTEPCYFPIYNGDERVGTAIMRTTQYTDCLFKLMGNLVYTFDITEEKI